MTNPDPLREESSSRQFVPPFDAKTRCPYGTTTSNIPLCLQMT
jgi:hypothetical protein